MISPSGISFKGACLQLPSQQLSVIYHFSLIRELQYTSEDNTCGITVRTKVCCEILACSVILYYENKSRIHREGNKHGQTGRMSVHQLDLPIFVFSLVSCNIAAISHLTSISGSTLTTLTLEEYQFLCFQLFCCINCCHCFLIFIFQLDKTKLCTSGVKKTRSFINSFNVPSITSSSAIPIFLVAIWSNIQ